MGNYETLVAFNPNLEKDGLSSLLDGFKEVIARRGGTVTLERDLGKKKFAYPVKKFSTGYYHLMFFSAPSGAVADLERSYKHAEDVLKFLTLRHDDKSLKAALVSLETIAPIAPPPGAPATATAAAPSDAAPEAPEEEEGE
jgi:small subunit ribosomal protein S6